jgi:predicted  nucleic acid-binding Zn-ribbon protein
MKKLARLRVCASCEWIFTVDNQHLDGGCPKCGFAHYGARYVYGDKAYRYAETQEPWRNKKVTAYSLELDTEIRKTNPLANRVRGVSLLQ